MDLQAYGVSETDIEFIRKKVLEGNWFTVTGDINAVTNSIEYIPENGKIAFLYSAKIIISTQVPPDGSYNIVKAALKVDSVTKDTTHIGMMSRYGLDGSTNSAPYNTAYGTVGDGRFDCKGLSLVGNGIKKITIENILDAGSAIATMTGWIEDT